MTELDRPSFVVPLEPPEVIAPARASATVIVARDGDDGLELFMLERHLRSDFAGGAYVFPGGTLDEADGDPVLATLVDGWGPERAREMGEPDEALALALVICAIRETFEESGILLARHRDGTPVRVDEDEDAWQARRVALAAGEITAAQLARETGIRYATDLVRYWSRLVTPEFAPKRYDTRFFVAIMPEGQRPLHDDVETTASRWITPDDALRQGRDGRFTIIFPTRKTLEQLTPFARADEMFDAAVDRPTEAVLPKIVIRDGDAFVVMPGDETLHEP